MYSSSTEAYGRYGNRAMSAGESLTIIDLRLRARPLPETSLLQNAISHIRRFYGYAVRSWLHSS
jgi:hypothetical protein